MADTLEDRLRSLPPAELKRYERWLDAEAGLSLIFVLSGVDVDKTLGEVMAEMRALQFCVHPAHTLYPRF